MILKRRHLKRLVAQGKAEEIGLTCGGPRWPDGVCYVIVRRPELNRTDHYCAEQSDIKRLGSTVDPV
jgi:hypothetical protein